MGTSARRGDEASGGGSARLVKAPSPVLSFLDWTDIVAALDMAAIATVAPIFSRRARRLHKRLNRHFVWRLKERPTFMGIEHAERMAELLRREEF